MPQSKMFMDASHALNKLSRSVALLESENASLRGAVEGIGQENAELQKLMRDGTEVGKALLRYRDNPPIKHAGPIEGTWYETGEILSIIMDKPEFSTGELLTRLAYLMGVRE